MSKLKAAVFNVVGVGPDPNARNVAGQFGAVYSGTTEAPSIEVGGEYDYVLLPHVLGCMLRRKSTRNSRSRIPLLRSCRWAD